MAFFELHVFHKWSFKREAQKVENRDFKNDAISLNRDQVLHLSGSFWASEIEEVALGLTNWHIFEKLDFPLLGLFFEAPFWLNTKISQTALKHMKFNQNIHLTSPIMLERLKLIRTSDIL